jgi:hypothetical protein
MPIKKRFGKYVKRLEDGSVEIRTPVDCTRWDNEFRLRIVRDYLPPRTMLDKHVYRGRFDPSVVYHIQGKAVMFNQPVEALENMPKNYIVVRSEVIDVAARRAMFLKHSEPAMRMLMVYSFIIGQGLTGVSLFSTYDWQP